VHDNPLHEGASDELVGDGTGSTVWGTAVDRPVHLIPAYGHIGSATTTRAAELRASSPVFTSVSSPLPLAGPSLPARSSSAIQRHASLTSPYLPLPVTTPPADIHTSSPPPFEMTP
jgi:hypothetical protein